MVVSFVLAQALGVGLVYERVYIEGFYELYVLSSRPDEIYDEELRREDGEDGFLDDKLCLLGDLVFVLRECLRGYATILLPS